MTAFVGFQACVETWFSLCTLFYIPCSHKLIDEFHGSTVARYIMTLQLTALIQHLRNGDKHSLSYVLSEANLISIHENVKWQIPANCSLRNWTRRQLTRTNQVPSTENLSVFRPKISEFTLSPKITLTMKMKRET